VKNKALALSLTLLMGAGLASCDRGTGLPTTGSIALVLVSEAGGSLMVMSPEDAANAAIVGGGLANIALDGVRVTVDGPTDKTVTATTASGGFFNVTVDGLAAGTYAVTVEGLVGGEVGHFGRTSGVGVVAGSSTPASVSFPVFQPQLTPTSVPDTIDVLRFTVTYPAVTGATSYIVRYGTSPTLAGASQQTVTGTTADVTVPSEGLYYVAVKAVNDAVTSGGVSSAIVTVFAFQGVASVTITPPTPTVAAGATVQLSAEARDADNAIVPNVSWFWASSNHTVATVSQTGLVTGVNGGSVSITAVGKGMPGSTNVGVNFPPPAKLGFVAPPMNTTAGQTIPAVQIAVLTAAGQVVASDNQTQVTVAIGTDAGPGGVLTGLQTVSVIGGVATFNNLGIAKAGVGYTLAATATSLTGATSANFNILPGAATHLGFNVQPTAAAANAPFSPAIQVTAFDALGNRVTSNNDAVTVAIGNNPGSGTLNGTKVVNAINGVASFSGLSISSGGVGYTLSATSGSLTAATSNAFDVGPVPTAAQLAFSIQPASAIAGDALSPAVQVEIRDASGNLVTTARDPVTIAFAANPGSGTLTGTKTVNAINGVASFTGLWVNRAAAGYTLSANSGTLTAATSTAFSISPAAPAKLAFGVNPINVLGNAVIAGAAAAPLTVLITDMFDNQTAATSSVTVSVGTNPWRTPFATGATLSATSGLLTRAAVAGVATFSDLRLDKPGPGYTLLANSGILTGATSASFNDNLTFTVVAVGGDHACGRTANGSFCWGSNWAGQIGGVTGNTGSDSIPSLVQGTQVFTQVTAGQYHSCGLTAAGAAFCWGYNGNGQLGINNAGINNSAVPLAVVGSLVFASIEAGGAHTCGITTASGVAAIDRQVYCWGYNGQGQIGDGLVIGTTPQYLIPTRVVNPLQTTTRATQISAGSSHTCARALDANVYCWGYNEYGQLGNGTVLNASGNGGISVATPQQVLGGFAWTSISAGNIHTCGIRTNHATSNPIMCWGNNGNGQLGIGGTTNFSTPQEVSNLNWISVSAGGAHGCGVLSGGQGYCWGYNGDGRLGDGTTTSIATPVPISGTLNLVSIHAGQQSACGRTGTGGVFCWGPNHSGQLGSPGTGGIKNVPTQVIQ
jgi:alpha-tubulin suppressor-like RCC1 family protein